MPAYSYDDYMRYFGNGNPLLRMQTPNFAAMPANQYQTPQIAGQMGRQYNNGYTGMITPQLQYSQGGNTGAYLHSQGLGGGNSAAAYYNSNPNNTAWQQLGHDIGVQARKPSAQNFLGSMGQVADAVQSYKGWKYARDQAHELEKQAQQEQALYVHQAPTNWLQQNLGGTQTAMTALSREGTGNPMSAEEVQASLDNEQQAATRAAQSAQVNSYFDSPGRAAQLDKYVGDQLNSQTSDINHQSDLAKTRAAQATAGQGLLGGSVDQERQADINRSHDAAITGAGQAAQSGRAQMTAQDQALREHLLSVVNASDPQQAAAAQASLQAIEDQSAGIGQTNTLNQQGQQVAAQNQQGQSQAIGSGITGISSWLNQNPSRGGGQWWGAGSSGTAG